VANAYRLYSDLETECYNKEHSIIAYGVATPIIIVWVIGSIAFAWIHLYRRRMKLDDNQTFEVYGFLYNGYKKDTYYWELVIMIRKMMVLVISSLLSPLGNQVQAFLLFLLAFVLIMLNIYGRPYITQTLNMLDNVSLVTSMATIFCGILYLSEV